MTRIKRDMECHVFVQEMKYFQTKGDKEQDRLTREKNPGIKMII